MSTLSFSDCKQKGECTYPVDTFTAKDGTPFTLVFFGHASLAIESGDKYIYIDPVSAYADYTSLPKADLILITHSHYDHLDRAAIERIGKPATRIICDKTSAETFASDCLTMTPGATVRPWEGLTIEAFPAYNTTAGHLQFHPREREDCGYLITLGGTRIYVAGDTENTPELKALHEIDIALLPVNQPYTMTVDQAVDAVKAIRPRIFYPYHYGGTDEKTDIGRLADELQEVTEVRIRPME